MSVLPPKVAESVTLVFLLTLLTVTPANPPPKDPCCVNATVAGTVMAALSDFSFTVSPLDGTSPVKRMDRFTESGEQLSGEFANTDSPGSTVIVRDRVLPPLRTETVDLYSPGRYAFGDSTMFTDGSTRRSSPWQAPG